MDTKLDIFIAEYTRQLTRAVAETEQYAYPVSEVPTVVARMRAAIVRDSYNHSGIGFKWTCKALGIPHTRKAIKAFIDGEGSR